VHDDAQENSDVAVIDIPNAFIQTRVEDEKDMAIVWLRGVLVDVLVEIAPFVCRPYANLVAKTLFATKRARPDTCTSIAFLTTKVRAPIIDHWRKLSHLMKYLKGSRKLPLILSANGSGTLKMVGGSIFRCPSEFARPFWWRAIHGQRIPSYTGSSTETELVGADDFMPAIIEEIYFRLDAT
jgi:hypothetical protein